jgi:hypothetical protein
VSLGLTHTQADHGPLKLSEGSQLREEQFPGRRVHIDPQVQDVDPDAESLPLLQGGSRIYQGSEATIHLGEGNRIPGLDEIPQQLALGSLLEGDLAGDILIDVLPAHLQAVLLRELFQLRQLSIGGCLLVVR